MANSTHEIERPGSSIELPPTKRRRIDPADSGPTADNFRTSFQDATVCLLCNSTCGAGELFWKCRRTMISSPTRVPIRFFSDEDRDVVSMLRNKDTLMHFLIEHDGMWAKIPDEVKLNLELDPWRLQYREEWDGDRKKFGPDQ